MQSLRESQTLFMVIAKKVKLFQCWELGKFKKLHFPQDVFCLEKKNQSKCSAKKKIAADFLSELLAIKATN